MYCIKCGSKIKEGARFCSKCGNPVVSDNETVPQRYRSVRPDHELRPGEHDRGVKKTSGSNKTIIIIIAVLAVLIIAAASFVIWKLVFSIDSDRKDSVESSERDYSESGVNTGSETEDEIDADPEKNVSLQEEEESEEEKAHNALTEYANKYLHIIDDYEDHEVYFYDRSNGYYFGNPKLDGKKINYMIRDFDHDSQDELLVVCIRGDCICLEIYEYDGKEVVRKSSDVFSDEYGGRVMTGGEGVTEVYIIDDTKIMIEESYLWWLFSDGVSLAYTIVEYNGDLNVVDHDRFEGSEFENGEYGSHFDKADIGEQEWLELFFRHKHMHDYIGEVEGLARFETVHCVTPEQFSFWVQTGESSLPEQHVISIIRIEKEVNDHKPGKLVPTHPEGFDIIPSW